ncbi:uncharacterized protein LOC129592443 [Paramacrobiotus metropolitanus]|uniref:uncharacterized protein LOC129592443 n=1 Tax=Paramacrobiotus metropolitanus TaxID=2943436 RepID=UPI0024457F2E|nr:uncharacterized protein LOC129592443 [Paramacrobiotus metropolitanus]
MLVYGDDGSVYGWNSVDVLVEGQLQHGSVINVADGGLIIDFQCTSQRGEFVEYGRIFHCNADTSDSLRIPRGAVQVLLRRRAGAAWLWYPGNVVPLGDYIDAVFVEVSLPHGSVLELLPWEQVRLPLSPADLEARRVKAGAFIVRSCRLAVPRWTGVSQRVAHMFRCELNRRWKALYISVIKETFTYLQPGILFPLDTEQVATVYKLARSAKRGEGMSKQTLPKLRRKRKTLGGEYEEEGLVLPPELLLDIFRSMDSVGRVRCRRVCALWNALLTTDAYFPDVCISGNCADYAVMYLAEQSSYWTAICLLKCLSNATTVVVLKEVDLYDCRTLTAPIQYIRQGRGMPVLVLYQCDLGRAFYWPEDRIRSVAQLGVDSGFERMRWVNCRFCDDRLQAVVSQHAFRVQSQEAMEVQLWDVLESSLILETPLDRPGITQWIADCNAHQRKHDVERILKGLWKYETADPRPSSRYRDREWTESDLADLDVTKLTTLTTVFLHGCLND